MKRLSSVLSSLTLLSSFLCATIIPVCAEVPDSAPLTIDTEMISKPTYIVHIPEKVEFGQLSKDDGTIQQPVSVSASEISNLFANQQKLVVRVVSENGYHLIDGSKKSKLAYTLYTDDAQTPINDGKLLEVVGSIEEDSNISKTIEGVASVDTSEIKKAGNYMDTLTFTLSLQEVDE